MRAELEKVLGLKILTMHTVSGGDINEAFSLETDKGHYFLKVNNGKRFPKMFEKEANGLEGLRKYSGFRIPDVLRYGISGDQQFLLLELISTGRPKPDFWKDFAAKLAGMHRTTQDDFGWTEDNYLGNLVQKNTSASDWKTFFTECRILPFAEMLLRQGAFSGQDFYKAENLCSKAGEIFPSEPPAFVHGDLWAGNFMCDEYGNPVLIDPAVSFSHREMDIGLTLLFGGYPQEFYSIYNEIFPLAPGWQKRLPVAQLYPLLMHAVVFGGNYVRRCREIITSFS